MTKQTFNPQTIQEIDILIDLVAQGTINVSKETLDMLYKRRSEMLDKVDQQIGVIPDILKTTESESRESETEAEAETKDSRFVVGIVHTPNKVTHELLTKLRDMTVRVSVYNDGREDAYMIGRFERITKNGRVTVSQHDRRDSILFYFKQILEYRIEESPDGELGLALLVDAEWVDREVLGILELSKQTANPSWRILSQLSGFDTRILQGNKMKFRGLLHPRNGKIYIYSKDRKLEFLGDEVERLTVTKKSGTVTLTLKVKDSVDINPIEDTDFDRERRITYTDPNFVKVV